MIEGAQISGEDGTLAVLHAMLTTFADVLEAMDRRLGTMEEALRSLQSDNEQASELRHALQQLGRVEGIEAELSGIRTALEGIGETQRSLQLDQDQASELRHGLQQLDRVEGIEAELAEIRVALRDHPAASVFDAVRRLTGQVDSLVAQPGPGPAMAMVAAGLSERFEQRTQSLVELLQEHAELMHALTEQIQGAMQGLVTAVEGRQAGLDALLDTVRAVAATIEGMGARIEEARDGVDAVFQAGEDLPAAVSSLCALEEAIREMAENVEDHSAAGISAAVRDESELLAQRLAAISVSLDSVRAMLVEHVEESAHSLGRKASEAGRRLVADLGLASKPRAKGRGVGSPPEKRSPRRES